MSTHNITSHKSLFREWQEYHYEDGRLNWTTTRRLRPWVAAARWMVGIALVVSLLCGAIYGGYALDRRSCQVKARRLHLVEQWAWRVGCQVQMPDGRIVDIDKIRFNENGSPA